MWQIALTLFFIMEYWYYFAIIALFIVLVISFNAVRKQKRVQIHKKYREMGVLDTKDTAEGD
ncbi:hypothetical protein NLX71_25135 [Paenibacillus sp. MZ04-78.2]|uniref:hypothetical protein n=1 Tax=Paenibacillus sp. MZ04-78.2 TaxID=2962034 RepID=UPI0020B8BFC1|nr:hypothetical protein [Paenibacillus sp. MZ04-78.2]MCP3776533.1 hypothetical protein [Paenibacillus sp. MZ04-78.2]